MQFNEEQKALYKTVKEFGENEILPFVEDWEKSGSFPAHELFKNMLFYPLTGLKDEAESVENPDLRRSFAESKREKEGLSREPGYRANVILVWKGGPAQSLAQAMQVGFLFGHS